MNWFKNRKLQTKMSMLIVGLLLAILILLGMLFSRMVETTLEDQIGNRALTLSQTVAKMPAIKRAFETEDPSKIIQPLVEEIRQKTDAEFIVVGNNEGIRYSHPIPERIGRAMVGGDSIRALEEGESYVSKAVGSLGPSLRGKTPIFDEDGNVIGIVSVGFLIDDIEHTIDQYEFKVLTLILLTLMVGLLGATLIARGFKKSIFGLEPAEIGSLFLEKNAILESIREGIIAINHKGNITMVNQEAYKMLDFNTNESLIGKTILSVLPNTKMLEVLQNGESQHDREMQINNDDVIVNRIPLIQNETVTGVVSSFRKKTDIEKLSRELSQVQSYANVLRSQTHEYSNKLYTILGLIQLGNYQEAIDLIQKEAIGYQEIIQLLVDVVPDSRVSALLLGKFNRAHELHIELTIDEESSLKDFPEQINREKLVIILGNLLDNAMEAVLNSDEKQVHLFMTDIGNDLIFEVEDSGTGIQDQDVSRIFERGFSRKKGHDRGIGLHLVQRSVEDLGGYVTVSESRFGGAAFTVVIPKKGRVSNESNRSINH
ncbi:ATP-binding protein [Pseudalkalibacillus caeni]|uniref:histidine kinase n=1 Tax=Exobacillus caeni TaxID=2574798 RepID=A0A5R9FCD0_9BACL|nr:sensor histidine kinase [Pseudalkalibacillus caeni]TLS38543.1 sensor histidine kinase [Pseudalkalibacillus caeni]